MTTQEILEAARAAKQAVALASSRTRQSVLERMADALCAPDSVDAILAANVGKPEEQVAEDTERDYFMTAEEAVKYGIVDKILTSRHDIGNLENETK